MRRWLLALAGVAALAGCGSTSSTPPSSTSSPSTTSASTPRSTTTTTVTSSATTSAASTSAGGRRSESASSACRSGEIVVSASVGGTAVGHVGAVLRFRSTASVTCTLSGYPGATLVTAAGRDLPAARTPNGYLGGLAAASASIPTVRVAPGETVSAMLEGLDSDLTHGGGPCPRYARLLVTPPNETVTARMSTPLASICQPEVHPVVPGTTGRAS